MFHFNVTLTDQDYYEFNKFIAFHSAFGRKQLLQTRILFALLCAILAASALLNGNEPIDAWRCGAAVLTAAVLCALFQALVKPLTLLSLKMRLRLMKKNGKLLYSPSAELTFGEESVCSVTPTAKTEEYYQAIERVCYLPGRMIYLFTGMSRSYLLPVSAFASQTELESFLTFIEDYTGKRVETFEKP